MPVSRKQINGLLSLLGKGVTYCHPVIVGAVKNEMFDRSAFDLTGTCRVLLYSHPSRQALFYSRNTWVLKHDLVLTMSLVLSLQGH